MWGVEKESKQYAFADMEITEQQLDDMARAMADLWPPGLIIRNKKEPPPENFSQWCSNPPIILDGKPFTWNRHEYLIEPYADDHPFQVEEKAAQMGLTSKALLDVIYGARYGPYRGILYLFPSKADITDFSKGRVDPMLEDNPETIGHWIKNTNSANIKKIWNCFLYLRGMRSRVGLKSIPVDKIVFDELDEAPQTGVDMAMERMGHSEEKIVRMLSNPTLPDYGIDAAFKLTDQQYWLLKCPVCGHYTCLEDSFGHDAGCLRTLKGGQVIRACDKCGGELNPSIGEWVAKKPGVKDKRGRHYSQLFAHSDFVDPAEILHKFRTTDNLTDFYNLKIGIAYVEAENRLAREEVLNLCGSEGIKSFGDGCTMGVDQGKDLHVVIGENPVKPKIIHLNVYKDWSELDSLMSQFKVYCCVVDAQPETRNARAFAERFRGRVFLNYYNELQKGSYAWNEEELIVQCNRTESLDASHRQIKDAIVELPKKCDIITDKRDGFASHLHNVAKKLKEEEILDQGGIRHKTGTKRYIYVKLGPDHYRHAFNYECMARTVARKFTGLERAFG